MKKQLLLLVMILLPMAASADAVEIDGIYYNLIEKAQQAEVTIKPSKYNGDVEIPESVTYEDIAYSVTKIGQEAFYNCSGLISIIIPNSVNSIGQSAFEGCTGLTSVSMPNSITTIGKAAFRQCGATSITISNSLTTIEENTFEDCNLTSITIPNSVTSIGSRAFMGCTSLTSIDIPNSVTIIRVFCFAGCTSLTSVKIPDSVTWLGRNSFSNCTNLTSINIPNSVTTIVDRVFYGCKSLASIDIPNSVTAIYSSAFEDCSSLTNISLGSGIESIEKDAFANCSKLTDVYCYAEQIPKTDGNIFHDSYIEYAFLHVPDASVDLYKAADPWKSFKAILKMSAVPHALKYIVDNNEYKLFQLYEGETISPEPEPQKEGYTFSGWSEIPETMPDHDVTVTGMFTINKYKLIYVVDDADYKTIEVDYGAAITPEPVPTKEGYTFSGWSEIPETMPAHDVTVIGTFTINKYKLTYIVDDVEYKTYEFEYGTKIIPEPVPTKEGYTFSGWSEIPETMPANDVTVSGTFTINKYKLTYIVDDTEYKTYEVEYGTKITPEPVPTKEGYTFSGWSEIPETMPANDVTVSGTFTINKYKLIYIVDGEEYKVYEIEYGATITPEVEPAKEGFTFSGWSEIPETMPANDVIVTGTFLMIDPVVDNILYKVTDEGLVVTNGENSSGSVVIPAVIEIGGQIYPVIGIGEGAFKGNTAITSVSIDNGINLIGASAFEGCNNLIEIIFGSDIVSIGDKAFANFASSSSAPRRADEYGITIYCYPKAVPETATNAFENTPIDKALLLVYDEVINDYADAAPWNKFGTIQGFNGGTGIKSIWAGEGDNAKIYDLKGRRVVQPSKGLYIKNGKKYVVK